MVQNKKMSANQMRLQAYLENNNLKPAGIAIPRPLYLVLADMADRGKAKGGDEVLSSKQALITAACSAYYPDADVKVLPPLAKFPPPKSNAEGTGDPRFTWYADEDMLTNMRIIGARFSCSMRQLIVSAVLEYYKRVPEIKALGIKTKVRPSLRMGPATD